MFDPCNSEAVITDVLSPITFEDGSQREPLAVIFEDGSFVASTDEAAKVASRAARRITRWADQGKTDRIARFFDKGFDVITGL